MIGRTGFGDTPNVVYGVPYPDFGKLFYSDPRAALTVPITLSAGYGVLPAGTVIAKNTSAAGNLGKFFPYDPQITAAAGVNITGAEWSPARAYLVAEGTANPYFFVKLDDAYKFVVGDDAYAIDSDGSAVDLGAITIVDVTTYTHMAKITCTNNITTALNVAKFGYAYVEGADVAVGILSKSVDTGIRVNAKGANAELIIGNAVLYKGYIPNLDGVEATPTGVYSDLSAKSFGQFIYIK